jgi:hypothetical protein
MQAEKAETHQDHLDEVADLNGAYAQKQQEFEDHLNEVNEANTAREQKQLQEQRAKDKQYKKDL